MLIDIPMKFCENSLNSFQVIERTQLRHNFMSDKVPRKITQKALMQELWFLHTACSLMLVDICMKIHEDSLKGFKVIEWTLLRCDLVMVKVPREITKKV